MNRILISYIFVVFIKSFILFQKNITPMKSLLIVFLFSAFLVSTLQEPFRAQEAWKLTEITRNGKRPNLHKWIYNELPIKIKDAAMKGEDHIYLSLFNDMDGAYYWFLKDDLFSILAEYGYRTEPDDKIRISPRHDILKISWDTPITNAPIQHPLDVTSLPSNLWTAYGNEMVKIGRLSKESYDNN